MCSVAHGPGLPRHLTALIVFARQPAGDPYSPDPSTLTFSRNRRAAAYASLASVSVGP